MIKFELFNPTDGRTKFSVRGEWLARAVCWLSYKLRGEFLDYAKEGEGW